MQFAESGKIITHPSDNTVRQTTASESSRAMASGRPMTCSDSSVDTSYSRQYKIATARQQIAALAIERGRVQALLADLENKIRGGGRLSGGYYAALCAEQTKAVRKLAEVQEETLKAKIFLQEVSEAKASDEKQFTLARQLAEVHAILVSINDRLTKIETGLGII